MSKPVSRAVIKRYVDGYTNNVFSEIAEYAGLHSGDFSPEQEVELEQIQARLERLVESYIVGNGEEVLDG